MYLNENNGAGIVVSGVAAHPAHPARVDSRTEGGAGGAEDGPEWGEGIPVEKLMELSSLEPMAEAVVSGEVNFRIKGLQGSVEIRRGATSCH